MCNLVLFEITKRDPVKPDAVRFNSFKLHRACFSTWGLEPQRGRGPFLEVKSRYFLYKAVHQICFIRVLDWCRCLIVGCYNGSRCIKGLKPLAWREKQNVQSYYFLLYAYRKTKVTTEHPKLQLFVMSLVRFKLTSHQTDATLLVRSEIFQPNFFPLKGTHKRDEGYFNYVVFKISAWRLSKGVSVRHLLTPQLSLTCERVPQELNFRTHGWDDASPSWSTENWQVHLSEGSGFLDHSVAARTLTGRSWARQLTENDDTLHCTVHGSANENMWFICRFRCFQKSLKQWSLSTTLPLSNCPLFKAPDFN